jgi:hypothetical protein
MNGQFSQEIEKNEQSIFCVKRVMRLGEVPYNLASACGKPEKIWAKLESMLPNPETFKTLVAPPTPNSNAIETALKLNGTQLHYGIHFAILAGHKPTLEDVSHAIRERYGIVALKLLPLLENASLVNLFDLFHVALDFGTIGVFTEIVRMMLQLSDKYAYSMWTIIIRDYEHMALELVRICADLGMRVDVPGCCISPLGMAVKAGNPELVREFILRGADLETRDIFEWTALQSAIQGEHDEIALDLVRAGASLFTVREGRLSPLAGAYVTTTLNALASELDLLDSGNVSPLVWSKLDIDSQAGSLEFPFTLPYHRLHEWLALVKTRYGLESDANLIARERLAEFAKKIHESKAGQVWKEELANLDCGEYEPDGKRARAGE